MIKEKIIFGDFDSQAMGFDLIARTPNALEEYEITDTIPGVQGSLIDYSMMFGQRIFKPLIISYSFSGHFATYAERHALEGIIKNQINGYGTSKLYDSNIPENYYFLAKCSSNAVTVSDQTEEVSVVLQFTCNPPFMISEIAEGSDEWDTFNFDYDVSQDTSFTVSSTDVVPLINPGKTILQPKMTVTGTVSVTTKDTTLALSAGTYENTQIYLYPGINSITLSGSGTISFEFYKELFA
ncbi:hypothetical protein [Liquorilactobacillus vini]|uniref:hypothetical protein n=1 Tax=Liquorilactobacillus vini TaxID=238015 RepID=UPI0002DACEB6|nr:hypothetical protein [Liquorilactobacillus vini]